MKLPVLFLTLFTACVLGTPARAQLSIDRCQELARENYPLIKRHGVIEKTAAYNLSNAGKAYLPQFALNAKASYQSHVTALPAQIPGIHIDGLTKDQYAATIDIFQSVWDGGAVHSQKQVLKAGAAVEREQLEVDLYALEKRVNELFFGVLLLDAHIRQNQILQADLQRNYQTIAAYTAHGLAHGADLDAVTVEQLKAQQHYQQLVSGRRAYTEMLAVMIGQQIDESIVLEKPNPHPVFIPGQIQRPELQLFDAQHQLLETKKNAVTVGYMPQLHLFVQGGYGKPGLNMLYGNFSPFYMGGIRLTWNFGALYTQKNDRFKLALEQQNVAAMRETFFYHTHLDTTRQNIEIERLRKTIQYDSEIIALRENIRRSAEAKVASGTGSVSDLMREVNAENLAKLEQTAHEIELLMAIYELKFSMNPTANH